MADLVDIIAVWLVLAALASCAYDIFTYEARQIAWEKAHPGATYMRHYRKLQRKSMRAAKKMGEP